MRKILAFIALVLPASLLFTGLSSVSALNAPAPTVVEDLVNCTITFNIDMTGAIDDGGGMDLGRGVLTDGANNVLLQQPGAVPVGITVNFNFPLTGPLPSPLPAGPYTFTLYDTTGIDPIGTVVTSVTYDPTNFIAACGGSTAAPDDGRIDSWVFNGSDLAVYPVVGEDGSTYLNVYGVNDKGEGFFLFSIAPTDFGEAPDENTELKTFGKITLYHLSTGELQVNIGPDAEGKVNVIIFDGLPPTNIYGYSYNVNDI